MLRLDLTSEQRWLDLGHGVRLRVAPLTTALMVAARADLAVAALPETASPEALARAATISAVVSGASRRRTPWPRSSQRGSEVRSSRSMISSPPGR